MVRSPPLFVFRLHPDLTAVDLKSYLDSSLNLDVADGQEKFTTKYSSFPHYVQLPTSESILVGNVVARGCVRPMVEEPYP